MDNMLGSSCHSHSENDILKEVWFLVLCKWKLSYLQIFKSFRQRWCCWRWWLVVVLHVEFDIPLSLSRGFMSLWSDWCEILSLQQNIKEHISSQPAQFQWKFKQPAFTADSWETKEQVEMVIRFHLFEYLLSSVVAPKVAQYTSADNKYN